MTTALNLNGVTIDSNNTDNTIILDNSTLIGNVIKFYQKGWLRNANNIDTIDGSADSFNAPLLVGGLPTTPEYTNIWDLTTSWSDGGELPRQVSNSFDTDYFDDDNTNGIQLKKLNSYYKLEGWIVIGKNTSRNTAAELTWYSSTNGADDLNKTEVVLPAFQNLQHFTQVHVSTIIKCEDVNEYWTIRVKGIRIGANTDDIEMKVFSAKYLITVI